MQSITTNKFETESTSVKSIHVKQYYKDISLVYENMSNMSKGQTYWYISLKAMKYYYVTFYLFKRLKINQKF